MSEPQALLMVREQLVRDRREARERRLARACQRLCAGARPSRWSLLVRRLRRPEMAARSTAAVSCCTA